MVLIILAVLGLCLGSFVNALAWRTQVNKDIVRGRSQCPNCGHQLTPADLVPVLSWLMLRGHCRYCSSKISIQYPLVELATAAVFVLSYIWWPSGLDASGNRVLFITWLFTATGLMALVVSDLKWMMLPNKILYPTFFISAVGRLVYIVGFDSSKVHSVEQWILSVIIASGFFWLLFTISSGRWIGYGDVRLGLITGTLLADASKSVLMIVLSSFIGTLFVMPLLALRHRTWGSRVPYGPFLVIAAVVSLLFGTHIIDWYKNLAAR